jgi:preprotein translocase subunit SecD
MRSIGVLFAVFAVLGCDGFGGGEYSVKPGGPPVVIVNPQFIVLRPVSRTAVNANASRAVLSGDTYYFDASERILDLSQIDPRTASVQERAGMEQHYVISIETTADGSAKLREWTSTHLEQQLGVFVDGELISAPFIKSAIDGGFILDGGFSKTEAEGLVARLRRGGSAS